MGTLKTGFLALIGLCAGCNGFRQWFDSGVSPPHDVRWAVTGATLDASLQVAKVPVGWRFAADATAAVLVRMTPLFGKNLDSGLMLMTGATFSEILGQP
jgi:hypothetical protein